MKQGALTLVGVIFIMMVSLVVSCQLVSYQDCLDTNRNLVHEYKQKIQQYNHRSVKVRKTKD